VASLHKLNEKKTQRERELLPACCIMVLASAWWRAIRDAFVCAVIASGQYRCCRLEDAAAAGRKVPDRGARVLHCRIADVSHATSRGILLHWYLVVCDAGFVCRRYCVVVARVCFLLRSEVNMSSLEECPMRSPWLMTMYRACQVFRFVRWLWHGLLAVVYRSVSA